MLHLVRIGIGASISPGILALDHPCTIAYAFRAYHTFTNPVRRTFNLPAGADGSNIAGIEKLNTEMVEDITVLRARSILPSAHTMYLVGKRLESPVNYIDIMHVLFANVVTR
jgi:hypothetical protein